MQTLNTNQIKKYNSKNVQTEENLKENIGINTDNNQFLQYSHLFPHSIIKSVKKMNLNKKKYLNKESQTDSLEKTLNIPIVPTYTEDGKIDKDNNSYSTLYESNKSRRIPFNNKRSSSFISIFNTILPKSFRSPHKSIKKVIEAPVYKVVAFNVNAVSHMIDRNIKMKMKEYLESESHIEYNKRSMT